jgi:hypothetical protein
MATEYLVTKGSGGGVHVTTPAIYSERGSLSWKATLETGSGTGVGAEVGPNVGTRVFPVFNATDVPVAEGPYRFQGYTYISVQVLVGVLGMASWFVPFGTLSTNSRFVEFDKYTA